MRRARWVVLGLVFAAPLTAHATIVQRLSVEELARAARVVAVARVESVNAAWEPDRAAIRTHVTLVVESVLAGHAAERIHVSVLGGRVDGIDAGYSAGAAFRQGARVVVFLEPRGDREGEWLVTGAFQGLFSLEREAETGMDVALRESVRSGVALVGGNPDEDEQVLRLYLDELAARVRAVRGAR